MKKRIVTLIMLAVSLSMLAGCTLPGSSAKKEEEYREQGIALLEAGEYELAVEMFDLSLGQTYGFFTKTELDICYYKALCQYKNGDVIDALNTYDGIIELKKKDWRAYYLRGTVYLEEGDFEGALKDYESAASLNGKDTDMLMQIAVNLENAGDETNALTYYNMIIENGGKGAAARRNIGEAYYKIGNTDEATGILEEAIEDGDIPALLYMADIYMETGDYETALSLIEEGLLAEETDDEVKARFMFAKVICYEYMAEWESAKTAIEEYTEAYPDDEDGQREYTFLENR